MRKIWRWGAITAGVLLSSTAAIGVLHMPFAKNLLMKLGGCPLVVATPAQAEAAQRKALVNVRGEQSASKRPALGFALEHTTVRDVMDWARVHDVDCHSVREETLVLCEEVPAEALGERPGMIQQVALLFRQQDGALINITTTRTGLSAEQSERVLGDVSQRLRADLGAPHVGGGERTAQALATPAKSFLAEYRFSNYVADTSAMNMGARGIMVREHYIAVTD